MHTITDYFGNKYHFSEANNNVLWFRNDCDGLHSQRPLIICVLPLKPHQYKSETVNKILIQPFLVFNGSLSP